MLALIAVAGIIVYGIGLRADRIHAGRAVTEPGRSQSGKEARRSVRLAGVASPGSVTTRLYRHHSAGYWNWQYRVSKRQSRNAVRYARKLERIIRSRRHPAPTRTLYASSTWDGVARCESGGNWSYRGPSGFEGGLQFLNSTWIANGGGRYAAHAYDATREQQIAIAERVLAASGWEQWPACSAKLGLR